MRLRAALVLALFAVVVPAPAEATQLLKGQTSQSRAVAVWLADDGRVRQATLRFRARCTRPGASMVHRALFVRPFDTATPDRLLDAGVYRLRQRGGFRLRVAVRLTGARDPAAARWTGTLRVTVVVRRHGRWYDRCRTGAVTWSVSGPPPPGGLNPEFTPAPDPGASEPAPTPAPAPEPTPYDESTRPVPGPWRFEISGDAREWITGGQTWAHGPPSDTITVWASPKLVQFSISASGDEGWHGAFAAPPGEQLTAGRTYTGARRYPFNESSPGLEVNHRYRGCNEITGEFTVHELAFDARGILSRFLVTFVQQCVGHKGTARGTFDFTAAS